MKFTSHSWLNAGNHCTFNRDIAKALGINAALAENDLIDKLETDDWVDEEIKLCG